MALKVAKMDLWVASIKDEPGALAKKLSLLAQAGANLSFFMARRTPEKRGRGAVFLSGIHGAKQFAAARKAGLRRSKSIHALRVEGPNKPGVGACITCALAEASINLRGMSAAVIGRKFVAHLALDSAATVTKAARLLRKL
ncbi:hypothetical protein LCGC14_2399000 [marine sediment metagenome]|uniref:ACT domain-containing protein n=1 Tax=marine sediment metagenome TaxID=412755 RepID=A0A0F9E888_9ZZZZ